MTILITAGTGNIGAELAVLLSRRPDSSIVRVGSRNPSSAVSNVLHATAPDRIVPVRFDPDDAQTLGLAFEGVEKLVLITPLVDDMVGWQRRVLDAVPDTLRQVVKVSVTGARPDEGDHRPGRIPLSHWEGEEMVRALDVSATMVRPAMFMQHFMVVRGLYDPGDDRIYMPSGDGRIAMNDCRDVALAVENLLFDERARRAADGVLEMTGPEALTGREMAERIGHATGRSVEWVGGKDAFELHSRKVGADPSISAVYGAVYPEAAEGWFDDVKTDGFEAVTGRRPRSFAAFAFDHRGHFAARRKN